MNYSTRDGVCSTQIFVIETAHPGPRAGAGRRTRTNACEVDVDELQRRLDPRRLIVVFMESLNCAGRQSCAMVAVASEAVTTAVAR